MIYVYAFWLVLFGFVFGLIVGVIKSNNKPIGLIMVDTTESHKDPYLYLNISQTDLVDILNKKQVTLDICEYKDHDSQK